MKFVVEIRFDGRGDFTIWKKKMKMLLVQQKKMKVESDDKPEQMIEDYAEVKKITRSTIILYDNNIFNQIVNQ